MPLFSPHSSRNVDSYAYLKAMLLISLRKLRRAGRCFRPWPLLGSYGGDANGLYQGIVSSIALVKENIETFEQRLFLFL
jgi:hypothetical protein